MKLDLLITGADVHDGLGGDAKSVAVGVRGDRIAYVGETPAAPETAAAEVVDAPGRLLCPGFIDTHASTGLGYMLPNAGDNKLFQGVTTEISGNCGTSSAPIGPLLEGTMHKLADEIGFTFSWLGLGEWFGQVESYGLPFNVGTYIGHSTLRAGRVRDHQQVADGDITQMADDLDRALREGALGLSTGLVYAPGSFATTDEIVELARVAARNGGIYVSHVRDERQELEASIEEAIDIGSRARRPVLVSHLKAAERPNWGKLPRVTRRIDEARAEGAEILFEVYPYTAVSTKLRTFIPKKSLQRGVSGMVEWLGTENGRAESSRWLVDRGTDFDAMVVIGESIPGAQNVSIGDLGRRHGKAPEQMTVDLLLADPDAWIVYHCLSEDDLDHAVAWEQAVICSDSWSHPVNAPNQFGDPHPRTFGAFTRFLERWPLAGRMPMGEAIRRMTSLPADTLRLPEIGRIREGAMADLVLLDPERVREKATYEQPRQYSEGTDGVWVSGVRMLEDGAVGDAMPGRVVRRA
ncbi:MAG: amidohydrolase family protein [Acidobacteriota bacterium]